MTLRPMTMADADKMLEWKNYEETRKFSISTPHEISAKDHFEWLQKNLEYFSIIMSDRFRVGAVRRQNGEISIWIDRDFRGFGYATDAIKMVSKIGNIARIVDGNVPSFRAFLRAGFFPIKYEKNFYILKL